MKKVLFTGGGSAGHVVPNIALINALKGEADVCYIGTDGPEKTLVSAQKIPYFQISCPKLVRGFSLGNLKIPAAFLRAERQAREGLLAFRPDIVFSKGGYVALPVVFAAKKLKIPCLTHESDLSPGLANRLMAGKCRYVLTSFPETAEKFRNGKYCGSPLREELFGGDREAARKKYGFSGKKKVLLVFGGGSGSRAINDALRKCVSSLARKYDVLHLCGKGNVAESNIPGYVQREFERDMADAYAAAGPRRLARGKQYGIRAAGAEKARHPRSPRGQNARRSGGKRLLFSKARALPGTAAVRVGLSSRGRRGRLRGRSPPLRAGGVRFFGRKRQYPARNPPLSGISREKRARPCPARDLLSEKEAAPGKIAAVVSCLLLLCVLLAVYFQHNVTKVLISVSEATMRAHTTVAINDAVYYTLSDGVRYEDLVTVERNDAGEVTALSADSLKINKIARDAASISQSNLKNLSLNGIPVPLGALTGIEALAGFGPRIYLRIIPVSSVTCEFSSQFESVGINQTKHSLYLNVIADISIVMPSRTENFAVTTDILVCECVLIGKVPDVYLQGDIFGNKLPLTPS